MGIFGTLWGGIKGAATGFLTGGPIGAAVGGGLGLGSSIIGGGGGGGQQGFMPGQKIEDWDAFNSQVNESMIRRAYGDQYDSMYQNYLDQHQGGNFDDSVWGPSYIHNAMRETYSKMDPDEFARTQMKRQFGKDWQNPNSDLVYSGFNSMQQGSFSMQGPSQEMRDANQDFQYWEPTTTQSDINASNLFGEYADQFQGEADRYGDFEQQLFDQYMSTVGGMGDGSNFDEAAAAAAQMGGVAGGIYFGGDAGRGDTFQGQVQQALQSVGQTGFGTSSGVIGNAMTNAAKQGGDLAIQQMTLTAPDVLRTMTSRDIAMMQNLSQNFGQYGGLRANALESAFGADSAAAEVGFARGGERQNRDFFRKAEQDILDSLKTKSWGQQQAEKIGSNIIDDLYDFGVGAAGDWWSNRGQGDSRGPIESSYDDWDGGVPDFYDTSTFGGTSSSRDPYGVGGFTYDYDPPSRSRRPTSLYSNYNFYQE